MNMQTRILDKMKEMEGRTGMYLYHNCRDITKVSTVNVKIKQFLTKSI